MVLTASIFGRLIIALSCENYRKDEKHMLGLQDSVHGTNP